MKLLVVTALAAVLVVPAAAQAQVPKGKVAARLTGCDAEHHSAIFQGSMKPYAGAKTFEMRFTLQSRDPITRKWARVGAPAPFEQWLASKPDVMGFVYDKGVDNLPVGFAYRVVVKFRFRDATGAVVGRAVRDTKPCKQPDERANLEPVKVTGGPVGADGMRAYEVTITNTGRTATPASDLALDVGLVRAPLQSDPGLQAGGTATLTFVAPACATGESVTATVDASSAVDETDEDDNALTVPCPTVRNGRWGRLDSTL